MPLIRGALFAALLLTLFTVSPGPAYPQKHGCGPSYPSDALFEWECVRLKKGETLEGLFGDSWADAARFNRIDRRHAVAGALIKAPKDLTRIKDFTPLPAFYPPAEKEPKLILVDLSEQFLGAYESGRLVFSTPAATGEKGNETPAGTFRISAYSLRHRSSKYFIRDSETPYPMNYALRFHVNREGVSYWLHGRDIPGRPASHGCIGLYDEEMQGRYYGYPKDPVLTDAKRLFEWAIGGAPAGRGLNPLTEGPKLVITGKIPAP